MGSAAAPGPRPAPRSPKLSPLQLTRCLTTEFSFKANPLFDRKQRVPLDPRHLSVETSLEVVQPPEESKRRLWSIELKVAQDLVDGLNVPYEFRIVLTGYFAFFSDAKSETEVLRIVRVNGSSVLYGIAREIVRTNTARGPWREVLLPSVSFYEPAAAAAKKPLRKPPAK
jgi:preprotein translocase subunit SecB